MRKAAQVSKTCAVFCTSVPPPDMLNRVADAGRLFFLKDFIPNTYTLKSTEVLPPSGISSLKV